jgi:ABC-2 type transport system ATP-binding protein
MGSRAWRSRWLPHAILDLPALGFAGVLAGILALAVGPLATTAAMARDASGTTQVGVTDAMVPVGAEPDGSPVALDTTVFTPGPQGRHPAVLLAHGFGGSKADLEPRARALAARGYVVLTWTARGFGGSQGRIHLDDPAFEGADVKALVDVLAARPDVTLDADGDPRVGIAGGSYGGAVGLIAAGLDPRLDVVASAITWHDLADALFPQGAVPAPSAQAQPSPSSDPVTSPGAAAVGPVKQLWISRFFAASVAGATRGGPSSGTPASSGGAAPLCGRFDPTVCTLLLDAAETGTPRDELLALLRAHSPAAVLAEVRAPVLLIQGMADSLFGIDQADATAKTLAAQGTPVAVRWIDGGHDAPSSTAAADDAAADAWLDHYLRGPRPAAGSPLPVPAFTYAGVLPRRASVAPLYSAPTYPGLDGGGAALTTVPLRPTGQGGGVLLTPPGGAPASTTVIPGLGAAAGALGTSLPTYALAALPGQSVAFDTRSPDGGLNVVGSPRLDLRITSSGPVVTAFVSLWQVQGAAVSQPRRLVVPLRVALTPGVPTDVTVTLPAATWEWPAGSTWRVLVTSTDSAFANPREARADRIEVVGGLRLPTLTGTRLDGAGARDTESIGVALAIGAVVLAIVGSSLLARRRRRSLVDRPDLADVPLVVSGLVKTYADGHRAVDDVSWRAEKGQVVGLLGPNGAGKTTTIRMVLGLIAPDSGTVHVMGEQVGPGSTVLRRVGALVEGPGFLPHLTGRENLEAYWRATGRPASEAGFDEALAVAALGGALERPVKTYSHGMKQRLGIAQAMLGLPELLILDEPTNGLDPPQIAAMRPILHAYAAAGRTVVVSSHLLGEVEQTCSHVVVMHAGRVVTTGAVADLVASEDTTVLELGTRGERAGTVAGRLRGADGIRTVDVEDDGAHGRLTVVADRPRGEVVRDAIAAGADVVGVGSRRHLEEVFLGVIAQAAHADTGEGGGSSLIERLRQVRAR